MKQQKMESLFNQKIINKSLFLLLIKPRPQQKFQDQSMILDAEAGIPWITLTKHTGLSPVDFLQHTLQIGIMVINQFGHNQFCSAGFFYQTLQLGSPVIDKGQRPTRTDFDEHPEHTEDFDADLYAMHIAITASSIHALNRLDQWNHCFRSVLLTGHYSVREVLESERESHSTRITLMHFGGTSHW